MQINLSAKLTKQVITHLRTALPVNDAKFSWGGNGNSDSQSFTPLVQNRAEMVTQKANSNGYTAFNIASFPETELSFTKWQDEEKIAGLGAFFPADF